jgi:hypothetical protein
VVIEKPFGHDLASSRERTRPEPPWRGGPAMEEPLAILFDIDVTLVSTCGAEHGSS